MHYFLYPYCQPNIKSEKVSVLFRTPLMHLLFRISSQILKNRNRFNLKIRIPHFSKKEAKKSRATLPYTAGLQLFFTFIFLIIHLSPYF